MKKNIIALASATILAVAGLAACGTQQAGSPQATTTVTTQAQPTHDEEPSLAVIGQYKTWIDSFQTAATNFSSTTYRPDNIKYMAEIGTLAWQGKALPSLGSIEVDAQWQQAMDDLVQASTIGVAALKATDAAGLEIALSYVMKASDHIALATEALG